MSEEQYYCFWRRGCGSAGLVGGGEEGVVEGGVGEDVEGFAIGGVEGGLHYLKIGVGREKVAGSDPFHYGGDEPARGLELR